MNIVCTNPDCKMTTAGCPLCPGLSVSAKNPQYIPGCICPPTSERTCMNPICPRKGSNIKGLG